MSEIEFQPNIACIMQVHNVFMLYICSEGTQRDTVFIQNVFGPFINMFNIIHPIITQWLSICAQSCELFMDFLESYRRVTD